MIIDGFNATVSSTLLILRSMTTTLSLPYFSKKEDLEKAKKYYDEPGNSAPIIFFPIYAKGDFL